MLSGVSLTLWIVIGAQIYPPPEVSNTLCVSTTSCEGFQHLFSNASSDGILGFDSCSYRMLAASTSASAGKQTNKTDEIWISLWPPVYEGLSLYRVSYIWYSLIAVVIVLVVGVVVSVITGANDANDMEAKLISPIYHFLCDKLPPKWRKKFACKKEEDQSEDLGGSKKIKEVLGED